MEYQLELSPLQIILNLEVYFALKKFYNIKIDKQEINKIKKGVKLIGFDAKKNLTTVRITYISEIIKPSIIEKINYFFEDNTLENHLQDIYNYIVKKAHNPLDIPTLCEYLPKYFKEMSINLLIDVFSEHFAELIHYMIKMSLRKDFDNEEIELISNNLTNKLLTTEIDFSLLNKYLKGQYWTSPRHLDVVSNTSKPLKKQFKNTKSSSFNPHLIKWVKTKVPLGIKENFQTYLNYIRILNNLKIIDAQIQIQSAFILKNSIKSFINKSAINIDYPQDVNNIEPFIKNILENCEEIMLWDGGV